VWIAHLHSRSRYPPQTIVEIKLRPLSPTQLARTYKDKRSQLQCQRRDRLTRVTHAVCRLIPPARFHAPQDAQQLLSRHRCNRSASQVRKQITLHPALKNRNGRFSPSGLIQIQPLCSGGWLEARVGIQSTVQVFVRGGVSRCFGPSIPGPVPGPITGFLRQAGLRNSDETMRRKESISNNAGLSVDHRRIPVAAVMLGCGLLCVDLRQTGHFARRIATRMAFPGPLCGGLRHGAGAGHKG
jgi:hypothetical protein